MCPAYCPVCLCGSLQDPQLLMGMCWWWYSSVVAVVEYVPPKVKQFLRDLGHAQTWSCACLCVSSILGRVFFHLSQLEAKPLLLAASAASAAVSEVTLVAAKWALAGCNFCLHCGCTISDADTSLCTVANPCEWLLWWSWAWQALHALQRYDPLCLDSLLVTDGLVCLQSQGLG